MGDVTKRLQKELMELLVSILRLVFVSRICSSTVGS
ncbi:hypothetical protein P879_11861 [Paragonimus westermani]|uniref:Uncharacterized protein n=1 Tax=Paragonimus westermani TaxID=34504 RepID=A0A8T0D8K4_9TREM|nr:hypothetical protein P879_11861 [Paragonimus westermani]